MKIAVDWDLCESHGMCVRVAPEAFELTSEDELLVLVDEVPAEQLPDVRRAVQFCPKGALSLLDDEGASS